MTSSSLRPRLRLLAAGCLLVLLIACAPDEDPVLQGDPPDPAPGVALDAGNACPAEGCVVSIESVQEQDGELMVSFSANFTPDIARNHFHVFWDIYAPEQVSDDAEPVHGVEQGDWEPTADNPYVTEGAASTSERADSTQLCVTAGDRDHNVLDPTIFECVDVSSSL